MLTVPSANIKTCTQYWIVQYKDLGTDANLFWNLKIINILDCF